jgi:hypothetical protein
MIALSDFKKSIDPEEEKYNVLRSQSRQGTLLIRWTLFTSDSCNDEDSQWCGSANLYWVDDEFAETHLSLVGYAQIRERCCATPSVAFDGLINKVREFLEDALTILPPLSRGLTKASVRPGN